MKALFQRIAYIIVIFSFKVGFGQNNLILDAKEVGTTTDFDFEIALDNTDAISALQFDINYNEDVLELANGHELSSRATSHTLAVSHPQDGVIRVILYSASNTNVQGASGLLATIKLRTKTLPGNFTLSVSNIIASDANQNTVSVSGSSGSLKVLGPLLQISASSINFGRVALGSTAQRSLSIQNNGTTDLLLTGTNAIQPFGIQQSFPITIAANSSQNLTITLDTSNKYNNTVSLVFQNNDPDALRRQTSVNLAAEVYAVNEIKVGSGNGEINTEIEIPVVIENMEPFNGFQFDIQLPTNVSYVANSLVTTNRKEDHSISASVVNGNTIRFLAYSPTNTDFKDNAGEVLRFKIKPNIQSGTYPLYIQNAILTHATLGNILSDAHNGSISIDAPSLNIDPSTINYNNVPITETRETTLRLTNSGSAQLNINELVFDNAELSLDTSTPIIIDAGQSKNVKLTFSPTTSGSFSETIAFRHNAANTQNLVTVTAQKFSPNYLTLVDTTAKFGLTNMIPISLENNDDLKAVQFDITLPNGFIMDVNALSTVNRAENFTAAASNVSGTTYRVIMYSASNTTIPKGSGAILQLPITLENSVNAGSYSFSFSNEILSDTNNKDVSSIVLTQGQITVIEEGSVKVTLAPEAINSLGGQWRISGGDWQNSGATLTELAVGNYTIEFKEVQNWNKPENKNISISKNQLTEVTGNYTDPDRPTIVISSDASDPTNSSFTATFTFSEDVTGFTIDDIVASNANVSNFLTTSSSVYSALISPISDGIVTLNIAEGVAQDAASNGNNAADEFSITYDSTKPTLVISSTANDPINTSFTTTFTFSEDVTGFTIDDISIANAGLSNFSSTSSSVYSVLVTPSSHGLVTLDIAEGVAQDSANNGNNAADQFSITYDNTKPTLAISSTASDPTNTSFTATFTFSEDVTGFEIGDIILANGTLSDFASSSAKVYRATITPTTDGLVTVDVNADVAEDSAGNSNSAASQFSLSYDGTNPTVVIASDASDPTNSIFTATFTFSEDVTGFDQSDVSLTNATLSNFASSSARVFTATITPTSDGVVTIDVNADVATDTAGNGNNAADQFSVTYDSTLSTENYELEKIKIFPNPVHDILTIQSEDSIESLILYSIRGKKLMEIRFRNKIDVSHLSDGIYFLRIKVNNGFANLKFVKK